jgi:hypothetical protein
MKKKQPIQALPNNTLHVRYPLSIISAISILLYIKSLNFGLTHLDDTIFINDFNALFSDIKICHIYFSEVSFLKQQIPIIDHCLWFLSCSINSYREIYSLII